MSRSLNGTTISYHTRLLLIPKQFLQQLIVVERRAAALLKPGGLLAVEHSDRQGELVPALLRDSGWTEVADHDDLTGRPRFTTARKAAP